MPDFHLDDIGPVGDCAVLRVGGEIDLYTAPQLRERMRDLAVKGSVHLIVDLTGVEYLDSTALGVLVGGLKRLRANDGSLALVINGERVLRIFRITGLTKVFTPYDSVPEAIAANAHWRETLAAAGEDAQQWCAHNGMA